MRTATEIATLAVRDAVTAPDGPGIYVLCLGEAIQYVGMSESPLRRVHQHVRQQKIPFDRYWIRQCADVRAAEWLERMLIHDLDPPCNTALRPRSEPRYMPTVSGRYDHVAVSWALDKLGCTKSELLTLGLDLLMEKHGVTMSRATDSDEGGVA